MIFVSGLKFRHHLGVIFETFLGFHRASTPAAVGHRRFGCSIFVSRLLSSFGIYDGRVEAGATQLALFDDNKIVEHQVLKLDDCCL